MVYVVLITCCLHVIWLSSAAAYTALHKSRLSMEARIKLEQATCEAPQGTVNMALDFAQ